MQNHSYQPGTARLRRRGHGQVPPPTSDRASSAPEPGAPQCQADTNLDYFDGNTVTGYWNYAQHYAISDNSFGTTFRAVYPGCHQRDLRATPATSTWSTARSPPPVLRLPRTVPWCPTGTELSPTLTTAIPFFDDCSSHSSNIGINNTSSTGPTAENVGDQLNMAGISWGWFEGGFDPASPASARGP